MKGSTVEALVAHLWPDGDSADGRQLFAVIDGARDPRIHGMLRDSGLEQACLFAGSLTPALQAAAPHLVHLAPQGKLTQLLLESGWDDHWFVLVRADPGVTLQQLRRHLRSLLRVSDDAGRFLMFRFYDPRVLRPYLPTCTRDEADALFGPIAEFACAGEDPASVTVFVRSRTGVRASTHRPRPGGAFFRDEAT